MVLAVAESAGRVGLWPLGSVVYSQSTTRSPTKHRDDCSGFVCMILGLPTPGLSTVGLRDLVDPIPASDIRRGDLLGNLGAGTEGNAGHVQWVDSVSPSGAVTVYEQTGGSAGPHHNTYKRPGFQAWRVRGAIDTGPTTVEDDMKPYIVNEAGSSALWLSDRITRRGLLDDEDVKGQRLLGVSGEFWAIQPGTLSRWGVPVHAVQPREFSPEALAAIRAEARAGAEEGAGLSAQELEDAAFKGAQRAEDE